MLLAAEIRPTLKTDQAAIALGLTAETLKKMRLRGQGPAFVRVGRSVRYDPLDIAIYIGARRVDPARDQRR